MKSKEYIRIMNNERRAWKDFEKITDQMEGKSREEIEIIESSEAFLKALKRWQKWDKLNKIKS